MSKAGSGCRSAVEADRAEGFGLAQELLCGILDWHLPCFLSSWDRSRVVFSGLLLDLEPDTPTT
jgi:hypothetical protein